MAKEEVHVGDIGTIFRVQIVENGQVIDISASSTRELYFRRPVADTVETVTGALTTDGADGQLEYQIPDANFLNEAGVWRIQARIGFPGGNVWSGEVGKFEVFENIYP